MKNFINSLAILILCVSSIAVFEVHDRFEVERISNELDDFLDEIDIDELDRVEIESIPSERDDFPDESDIDEFESSDDGFPRRVLITALAGVWIFCAQLLMLSYCRLFDARFMDRLVIGLSFGAMISGPLIPLLSSENLARGPWFVLTLMWGPAFGFILISLFRRQGRSVDSKLELPDLEGPLRAVADSILARSGIRAIAIKVAALGTYNATVQGVRACIVVVDRRMSESCSESDFASLIAHEAGHIRWGGALPYIAIYSIVLTMVNFLALAELSIAMDPLFPLCLLFFLNRLTSQSLEFACDQFALTLTGASSVESMLRKVHGDVPEKILVVMGRWWVRPFLSHPPLDVRIAAVNGNRTSSLRRYKLTWWAMFLLAVGLPLGSSALLRSSDEPRPILEILAWAPPFIFIIGAIAPSLLLFRAARSSFKTLLAGAPNRRVVPCLIIISLCFAVALSVASDHFPAHARWLSYASGATVFIVLPLLLLALLLRRFRSTDYSQLPQKIRRAIAKTTALLDDARPEDALDRIGRALKRRPGEPWLLNSRAACQIYLGHLADAFATLDAVPPKSRFPLLRINLCITQLLRGNSDEADLMIRVLCEDCSEDPFVWYLAGLVSYDAGHYKLSDERFAHTCDLKRAHGPALAGRVLCGLETGEDPSTLDAWMEAAVAAESNRSLVLCAAARLHQVRGNPSQGVEYMEAACDISRNQGNTGWTRFFEKLGRRWGLLDAKHNADVDSEGSSSP